MRHIRKVGGDGYHLNREHINPPQNRAEATRRWKRFSYKPRVISRLLFEQYNLCCYSELRADQHELGYHIEHVVNKSQCPERTFDYSNLAASALSSEKLHSFVTKQSVVNQSQPVFGGHAPGKQNDVDMHRFVSPHQADCAQFFAYLSDGRIVPAADLDDTDAGRAQYTIDLLNLNSPFLMMLRRRWWNELDQLFEEHIAKEMDLRCLVSVELLPYNQFLRSFFSLSRHFFGHIAEDVLRHDAPELL